MDIGYISVLNRIAYEQSRDEKTMKNKQAQEVEDAIIDEGI